MCLIVEKKYEPNNERRTAYKVFIKKDDGSLFSLYQQTPVEKEMLTDKEPDFQKFYNLFTRRRLYKKNGEALYGGAIHTFCNLEDAISIVKDMITVQTFYDRTKVETYVIYEVEGTNVIADGIFPCRIWDKPHITELKSVCFKSVRLIREIENK